MQETRSDVLVEAFCVGAGLWLLWPLAMDVYLLVPPAYGLIWLLALTALLIRVHLLGGVTSTVPAGWAFWRLQPLSWGAVLILLVALSVVVALKSVLFTLLLYTGTFAPSAVPRIYQDYQAQALGTTAILFHRIVPGPIIEEFIFRGWIQRSLERVTSAFWAILLSTLVFTASHFSVELAVTHVPLGLAAGYAVYVTRSIWAGVILHVGANALSFVPNVLVEWGAGQEMEFRALIDHLGGMGTLFLSIVCLSALLCCLAVLLARWRPRAPTERCPEVAGIPRSDPINES